MLDVERPVIADPFKELADRILEVQKQKEEAKKKATPVYGSSWQGGSGYNGYTLEYIIILLNNGKMLSLVLLRIQPLTIRLM